MPTQTTGSPSCFAFSATTMGYRPAAANSPSGERGVIGKRLSAGVATAADMMCWLLDSFSFTPRETHLFDTSACYVVRCMDSFPDSPTHPPPRKRNPELLT